ncbi:MAG: leucine-rich repeat domain-containing protein [Treponema sp.]|nr:leucine-rich repeat domain-containing protein [Treponema sp.]
MKRIFGKKAAAAAIAVLFSVSLVCTSCSDGGSSGGDDSGGGTNVSGGGSSTGGSGNGGSGGAGGSGTGGETEKPVLEIDDGVLKSCRYVKGDVIIPDGVTEIGKNAFYSCYGLTSITIPNSVTAIGRWTFSHCSNLTNITISGSVTKIGEEVFRSCEKLKTIYVADENEKAKWTEEKIGVSGVTVEVK